MHWTTHTASREETAATLPAPRMSGDQLMAALDRLDELSDLVGHIPAQAVALMVATLARRDAAAVELDEGIRRVMAA